MLAAQIAALGGKLSRFLGQFAHCFKTYKGRNHFRTYIVGQLGPLERKSVEPIADAAGVPPRSLQEFLSLLRWDADAVVTKIHEIVRRKHTGTENICIIDETSFPKKGTETACVQRQWCGATGKVDNCVVTAHTTFAAGDFHTLIGADLYLPESTWDAKPDRRRKGAIPDAVRYRPLHELALGQLATAQAHGVPCDWVTSDERYAEVPAFLQTLESWGLSYVVEVPTGLPGWGGARPPVWATKADAGAAGKGRRRFPQVAVGAPAAQSVKELATAARFRNQPWVPYRIKDGSKGPIVWEVKHARFFPKRNELPATECWLIVARNVLEDEQKYFVSNAPADAELATLLRVAFTRWRIERSFQDAKGEIGMGHFEVRRYNSIRRHLVCSMVSHLFLAEQRRRLRPDGASGDHPPGAACHRRPA